VHAPSADTWPQMYLGNAYPGKVPGEAGLCKITGYKKLNCAKIPAIFLIWTQNTNQIGANQCTSSLTSHESQRVSYYGVLSRLLLSSAGCARNFGCVALAGSQKQIAL
jgi:hypothetical protein